MKPKAWIAMAMVIGMWTSLARADENMLNAESDTRFEEGLSALKAGKWEQARASFLQVLAVTPRKATVLWNLAIAEHESGRYVEALGHLKAYFTNPNADLEKKRETKQELYDVLWKATGHLKVSADRGDEVVVNGEAKGKAPLADVVDVMPGKHHVAAGGRTLNVTVAAGETKEVTLVSFAAVPPAEEKKGKESYWTGQHITGVTLGGLAVVAAGLGIGFVAARESHVSDTKSIAENPNACADPSSGPCRQFGDARSSAKTTGVVSGVSFVAAGALAVGAVVLLWPKQTKEGSRVSARVIPTSQGVLIDGAF